ncbi:MAG: hypothetical protein P8H39_07555 [Thalassotalea sp.]|nr:hypothetical protein [Thalassotalea sp.]
MTLQTPDTLIIEGNRYNLLNLPSIDTNNPYINEVTPTMYSSACNREYEATWEVREDKLYLIEVSGKYKTVNNSEIFAQWFTGKLLTNKLGLNADSTRYEPKKIICMTFESGLCVSTVTTDIKAENRNDVIDLANTFDYTVDAQDIRNSLFPHDDKNDIQAANNELEDKLLRDEIIGQIKNKYKSQKINMKLLSLLIRLKKSVKKDVGEGKWLFLKLTLVLSVICSVFEMFGIYI